MTIFKGEGGVERDIEAYDLWVGQGVPKDRMFELGLKDNFWQMGDTGPCGPCSEIHYDMGPAASDQGHADCAFPCDCGRYVEIWNLVFMQFDRDLSGKLNPLPKPSIDTGMGLDRTTAVLQGVVSNYDTDLFAPLIKRAAELTGTSLTKELEKEAKAKSAASLRVIADHSRAATFLISDGVLPSNEGRGYVLRKIIRRAITHGRLLGQTKPFLHEMVFAVGSLMQDAYPELKETVDRISKIVLTEETRFAHTLDIGLEKLESQLKGQVEEIDELVEMEHDVRVMLEDFDAMSPEEREKLPETFRTSLSSMQARVFEKMAEGLEAFERINSQIERLKDRKDFDEGGAGAAFLTHLQDLERDLRLGGSGLRVYSGEKAFKLYDTYGMPLDFMQDAARDRGLIFDQAGFDRAMEEQKSRARASWKGAPSKPPIQRISSFRNRSSKVIGRLDRTAARCWRSSTMGRARRNSRLANRARSFLITRRFMQNPAGRLATGDGFTRTITIPSSPT